MARHFHLIFGGIFFIVGVSLLIAGVATWRNESRLANEGAIVEGKVLTRDIVKASHSSSSGSSRTRYEVTYRFATATGETFEDTDEVDVGSWEALEEQGPVTIQYLRDRPQTSRVAGADERVAAAVFTGLGGLFGLIGGGVLGYDVRRRREHARLRREGVRTIGTIVGVEETNFQINRVRQWRMRYQYRDQRGRDHEGKSGLLTPGEAARINAGDTGPVRYDRQHPERSIWLGEPDD